MASENLIIESGQKTVTAAGTKEPLIAGPQDREVLAVSIKALATNGGNIYVGGNDVSSTTGFILAAGESITFEVDPETRRLGGRIDMSQIYLDAAVNGEGVSFTYLRE